ncbi:MAG: protease HtpX [Myxococcota bacterium]
MGRIALLILTNLAVVLVIGILVRVLGLDAALARKGLNPGPLLIYSAVVGFTGSFVSLLISKLMARMATGAEIISAPRNDTEVWLFQTVERLAKQAGISMPEIAIYDSPDVNAFATGPTRNNAMVAVSTGLLHSMGRAEVEAVLAHEIGHVANGDMITMTLVQGVLNTFVIFLSRVIGYAVDKLILRNDDRRGYGIGYTLTVIFSQLVLGILATILVSWYSRRREYRADAASASLNGKAPMIAALRRLQASHDEAAMLPDSLRAFGIRGGGGGFLGLFRSHPPLADRIAALESLPG